ncbi:LruC domain-containing protein [Persicobacter psychrovividus]|uniref:DUF4842 domain-containing protein n=1 Tax=Persicobacter psychrovividus TaxID=387638 RepID=A0ABM7VI87_9BACT|nr:hypothetical protein PEPS_27550 [Persicobacter psychrovividus]
MFNKLTLLSIFLFGYLFTACNQEPGNPVAPNVDTSFESINVPEGFDFKTSHSVGVVLSDEDATDQAFYEMSYYDGNQQEYVIGRVFMPIGKTEYTYKLNLPTYVKELKVTKVRGSQQIQEMVDVSPNTVVTFSGEKNRILSCKSVLYGVNSSQNFFTIDQSSDEFTSTMVEEVMEHGGSIACAVDKNNKRVYVSFGRALKYYDLNTESWVDVAENNPFNGGYPRMEYNNATDELWIAKNEEMYILDPADGSQKDKYKISGLESPVGGGDIAISLSGDVYMCCFSGLYKVSNIDTGSKVVSVTRISAEALPFSPTSLAIDQDDRLFMGTNEANSRLIEMDKETGSYQVQATYPHKINDLSAFPCTIDECDQTDTDGDGCIDCIDEDPLDPSTCGTISSPSKFGYGTIAYEDLWPSTGDYDFNDLVVNYRFKISVNGDNMATKMTIFLKQKARSANYDNGFGIQMPIGLRQGNIDRIRGNINTGLVTNNFNGSEAGHGSRVVIIAYDKSTEMSSFGLCLEEHDIKPITITIDFKEPIDVYALGLDNFPYNPFLIQKGNRGHEIHLFNQEPTALNDDSLLGASVDESDAAEGIYYQTRRKHPWALNIIHDFRVVNEGVAITAAYNNFKAWAESGGTTNTDWYKDNEGYRNTSVICTDR